MGRIKLTVPADFIFYTEIQLRISDINYGGHLANDAVLALAHEARLQFLASHKYAEKNIEGYGIIMTDTAIIYKSEAFYGDTISIEIALDDITRMGFDLYYRLSNICTRREVAIVKTGLVFFDYEVHKIAATPEEFFRKFIH